MEKTDFSDDPIFWRNERGNILAYGRNRLNANDHLVAGNPFLVANESPLTPAETVAKKVLYPGEEWYCGDYKHGLHPYWAYCAQRVSEAYFISEDPEDYSGHMFYFCGMIDKNGEGQFFEDYLYNHSSNTEPFFYMIRQGPLNMSISEAELFPGDYISLNRLKHRGW